MSCFENAVESPPDPIFGLAGAFKSDKNPHKVDLMVGVYRDKNLDCLRLNSVYKAEKILLDEVNTKNYLAFEGDHLFLDKTTELLFGHKPQRVVAFQGIGGTGSLFIGGHFLKELGYDRIYVSDPTWSNHFKIFAACGIQVETYPYFDVPKTQKKADEMLNFFKTLKEGSLVLLHTCCHNPSGSDLLQDEWKIVAEIFKARKLIAFFDTAYQGFGDGLNEDVFALSLFLKEGLEFLCSQSFSKNFGLYGERVSTLYVAVDGEANRKRVDSHIRNIIRSTYSNPPRHGAEIIAKILSDPQLKQLWIEELSSSCSRLKELRISLATKLKKAIPTHNFDHLIHTKGMFAFIGLSKECVLELREKDGVYMTGNGRINISGLCDKNIDYVVESIKKRI